MDKSFTQNITFSLPGYSPAKLTFTNVKEKKVYSLGFLIDPQSISEGASVQNSVTKTLSGWHVAAHGMTEGTLSIQGVFIDSYQMQERLNFLIQYQNFMEDAANDLSEYMNALSQTLDIAGCRYTGGVSGLQLSKTSNNQFLYSFAITFLFVKKEPLFDVKSQNYSDKVKNLVDIDTSPYVPADGIITPATYNLTKYSAIFAANGGLGSDDTDNIVINGDNKGSLISVTVNKGMTFSSATASGIKVDGYKSAPKSVLFAFGSSKITQYAPVNPLTLKLKDPSTSADVQYYFVSKGQTFNIDQQYASDGSIPDLAKERTGHAFYSSAIYYLTSQGQIRIADLGSSYRFFISATYITLNAKG